MNTFHQFLFLLLLFSSINCKTPESKFSSTLQPSNLDSIQIIQNGTPLHVVERGRTWQKSTQYLSNSGIFNEIYADVYVKDADFCLKARLSLAKVDSSTALCLLFNNHFGFDSAPNEDDQENRFFFYNKKMRGKPKKFAPSNNFIQPNVPFDFEINRRGSSFVFLINRDTIAQLPTTAFYPPLEGYIGLRPWNNTMKLYNWSISGTLAHTPNLDYIFKAGEADYSCFRIPAIIKTKKGHLLAFAEGRRDTCQHDYGDIDLVLKRSEDAGETWSALELLIDHGRNTVGNPAPIIDQETGAIVLLYTQNLGTDDPKAIRDGTAAGTRRVFLLRSEDEGHSWSAPKEITTSVKRDNWNGYATGPGSGLQLQKKPFKGRMVVPCYHTRQDTIDYQVHSIISDDAGKNWKIGGVVPKRGVNESEIAELSDGKLIVNMRNAHYKNRRRQVAYSTDGGQSWQDQQFDSTLIEPQCQASLQYWPTQELLLFSNPVHEELRINLYLKASTTNGEQWQHQFLMHKGPAAYSDLLVLDDQRIGCLYEAGNIWPYQGILFQSIHVQEVRRN